MLGMGRITILDPTAPPPEMDPDPGPDAGPLQGRVVGIRFDRTWRSFEWAIDEWSRLLEAEGARLVRWCAGNRIGDEGLRTQTELATFASDVDLAIVGLGN
jgi:hypothetical protein